jgi:hypothetical protein
MDKKLKGFALLAMKEDWDNFPVESTITEVELNQMVQDLQSLKVKADDLLERATLTQRIEAQQIVNNLTDSIAWVQDLRNVITGKENE